MTLARGGFHDGSGRCYGSAVRWCLPVLLAVVLVAGSARAEERFALVIGANTGWELDKPLKHAQSDAERMASVLVELGRFPKERVTVLLDPDVAAVRARLDALSTLAAMAKGPTLVFVYYSGHSDSRTLHLRGAPALELEELSQRLRDVQATVRVGVIDACQAGAILGTKGGTPVAPFDVKVVDELTVRGLAVLTSSGADELSQETRALQGSVFTHHFVSGLRGAADADQNGQVTLSESYLYAHGRTEADTAATLVPQKPAFRYELKGEGELVMSWPAEASAKLVLPKGPSSRVVVVDEAEKLVVAEGRSDEAREVTVALVPGRYVVKQVLPEALNVAPVTLGAGSRLSLASLSFTSTPRRGGFVKGSEVVGTVVEHPRRAFWFVAGAAVVAGVAWAVTGGMTLNTRNQYAQLGRPFTMEESRTLTGWALASDITMGLTAALALGAVFTW
ncbi:MAG: caspase family protein [Myxococcaceae bacterium]|nr:caspase family protein [Myxococcaceae bacterium]